MISRNEILINPERSEAHSPEENWHQTNLNAMNPVTNTHSSVNPVLFFNTTPNQSDTVLTNSPIVTKPKRGRPIKADSAANVKSYRKKYIHPVTGELVSNRILKLRERVTDPLTDQSVSLAALNARKKTRAQHKESIITPTFPGIKPLGVGLNGRPIHVDKIEDNRTDRKKFVDPVTGELVSKRILDRRKLVLDPVTQEMVTKGALEARMRLRKKQGQAVAIHPTLENVSSNEYPDDTTSTVPTLASGIETTVNDGSAWQQDDSFYLQCDTLDELLTSTLPTPTLMSPSPFGFFFDASNARRENELPDSFSNQFHEDFQY